MRFPLLGTLAGAIVMMACTDGVHVNSDLGTDPGGQLGGVAAIQVAPHALTLVVHKTGTAAATALDASGKTITGAPVGWSSSNTTIAAVSSAGLVTAQSVGQASIVAESDGKADTAQVTVVAAPPPPVASITVAFGATSLTVGQTSQGTATPLDANGQPLSGRSIIWSSSNTGVATVGATGLVTAVGAGTAQIVANSEGVTGGATFTVTAPTVTVATVAVAFGSTSLTVGQTSQGTATPRDANGQAVTGRTVSWSSSNTAVVTVSGSGLATAVGAGTANVVATVDGVTGRAAFTVTTAAPVPVSTVTVGNLTTSMNPGQSRTASVTLRDASGNTLTGRTVSWTSSNTAAATVNQSTGVVTAVAVGTSTITATSEGKSGSATATVVAPPPPPSGSDAEPLPTDPGAVVVFQEDFEKYTSCGAMLTRNGGQWLTGDDPCDATANPSNIIFPESGSGYIGSPTTSGGRSARFTWPIANSEQYVPLDHVWNGSNRFTGKGQTEYYSYMYRAPGFVYYTQYPRVGKKQFLIFLPRDLTYEGRVTTYSAGWSLQQSVGGKIDDAWIAYPPGVTTEDDFNKNYITDGRWHRYTIMRKTESVTGAADGWIRMWMDGYLVVDRRNVGTYDQASSDILLAGTFNGGSSRVQTEYFDNVVAWHY